MRLPALCLALIVTACGNDAVSSAEDAKKAYLSLDSSIDGAIKLGFDGFNAASSANISPQTANGVKKGTLTVTGQVDQGSGANKGMRLFTAYSGYANDDLVTYSTDAAALPALNMQLKGIPTGTVDGTLAGSVTMTGNETGSLALNVTFTGTLQAGSGSTVQRVPGTTHVTGTATSKYGTYAIDITH